MCVRVPPEEEPSPGVYVGRLDGVEEELGHSDALHVDEVGLEQSLGGLEPLAPHFDQTAIWQLETRGSDETRRSVTMAEEAGLADSNMSIQSELR